MLEQLIGAVPSIMKLFGKKKSPQEQGMAQGQQAQAYYGSAFPGTTPWEQLGAGNPVGATQSAEISADNSLRLKSAEMGTQLKIAAMQTEAQKEVARIQTDVARQKVSPEIEKLITETQKLKNTVNTGSLRSAFEKKTKDMGLSIAESAKVWYEYVLGSKNNHVSVGSLFGEREKKRVESTPRNRNVEIDVYPFK